MIKYALKCSEGHQFDSWFQNSEAYNKLLDAGQLACAVCGKTDVSKAIMAPRVSATETPATKGADLSAPMSPAEVAMRDLKAHVEKTSENVGERFSDEVRAMHYGDAPERSVYGEAKLSDAKALWSEGIPVAPLPWASTKAKDKSN